VLRVLPENGRGGFLQDFEALQRRVAYFGQFNGLSQTLLKLTSPGVPDVYQGSELWDLSLVDPDNRRPVDYEVRRAALADVQKRCGAAGDDLSEVVGGLLERWQNGHLKLYTVWRTLSFRRDHRALFNQGDYVPLEPRGSRSDHLVAFSRTLGGEAMVVVVPRRVAILTGLEARAPLGALWQDTRLELPAELAGRYRNVFTGERLEAQLQGGAAALKVSSVLARFPVALLVREG